jgi:PAS domain S-box-containing protein
MGPWRNVLEHLGEAVIVLDDRRILRHVNEAARRLLGYETGQAIGSRCRLTTRGIDCENACPLTFALESGLDHVEDFATVYRTADGRALHLRVTVIPLSAENESFRGAVEILRPTQPPSGFVMAGSSDAVGVLRERATSLARNGCDVKIAGEAPACLDVARAIHRFSGLPDHLFVKWTGTWDDINPWPPGTVYAHGESVESLLAVDRPEGWRVVVGGDDSKVDHLSFEPLDLPPVEALSEDLSSLISAWVLELAPDKTVSPDALEHLSRMVRDRGFEDVERVLNTAVAASGDCIEVKHLPVDGYQTALVDEFLRSPNPLAALEERVLREVLERCGWRIQEAADRVGVSRVTLWRKMKDLGIEKNS